MVFPITSTQRDFPLHVTLDGRASVHGIFCAKGSNRLTASHGTSHGNGSFWNLVRMIFFRRYWLLWMPLWGNDAGCIE